MRARIALLAVVFFGSAGVAAGQEKPAVPDDFQIVARYGPGYSPLLAWKTTITADGKVVQDVPRRGGKESDTKEVKLTKDDVAAIYAKVKDGDFFKLDERYAAKVTDHPTLYLEVTAGKKTHKVAVYAHRRIQGEANRAAVDRFLGVYAEVLRKAPSPNKEETPDWYKPGDYAKK
jgi:hypothetical protein